MAQESSPTGNAFLDRLPSSSLKRLLPLLERVTLERDQVIDDSSFPVKYADFPVTALLSAIEHEEDGGSCELAMIGFEGMKALPLLEPAIWIPAVPLQVVVQEPGEVLRLRASSFITAVKKDRGLRRTVSQYYVGVLVEATQVAYCNRFHSIEQRVSRWLLRRLSHTRTLEFEITQGRIAYLLGARREAVSQAAGNLQRAGIISYRHGHLKVMNRSGLEASACYCHEMVVSRSQSTADATLVDADVAFSRDLATPNRAASPRSNTSRSAMVTPVPRLWPQEDSRTTRDTRGSRL